MITEALMSIFASIAAFFGGLMPSVSTPGWLADIPGWVASIGGYIVSVDAWLPFSHAATALSFLVVCLGASLVVRGVRITASFLTAGGGSAA